MSDTDTMAFPLILIAEGVLEDPQLTYGPDAIDPSTLFGLLEDKFNVELPESARNRLQAVLLLRRSELFETDPDFFIATALAFADGHVGEMVFGLSEEISKTEALWAVVEASLCDPYLGDFGVEVSGFLDDLMQEPEDMDNDLEEEDDLSECFSALAGQLKALRIDDAALERITKRATSVMGTIIDRFGDKAAV